jgi:hypothetical protein
LYPGNFHLAGTPCSVTPKSGAYFRGVPNLFSGFAAAACRSIFAMVFAQVFFSDLPVRPYSIR